MHSLSLICAAAGWNAYRYLSETIGGDRVLYRHQTMFGQIIGQTCSGFLPVYRCIGLYRHFGQNKAVLAKIILFWPKQPCFQ